MKVTKEVRNSNDYNDKGEIKGQYIYITYKDEENNKVLEITIQKNRDDYAVYFDIPINLNLNYKQSSLIEMDNYFISNLSEVDKVIEKRIALANKAIALFQRATILGMILCIITGIISGMLDASDDLFLYLAIASAIYMTSMFIGLIIGNVIGNKLDELAYKIKKMK